MLTTPWSDHALTICERSGRHYLQRERTELRECGSQLPGEEWYRRRSWRPPRSSPAPPPPDRHRTGFCTWNTSWKPRCDCQSCSPLAFQPPYTLCEGTTLNPTLQLYASTIASQVVRHNIETQTRPLHVQSVIHFVGAVINFQLLSLL